MKFKTSVKNMKINYYYIVSVDYGGLATLLRYQREIAYNAGVYGWNCDFYDISGVLIATGYRNMPPNKNVKCDYEIIDKYEKKAQEIASSNESWESIYDKTNSLLYEFINEITPV
jgi:hypothetical protein